jgi:hypothetical protein
MAIERSEISGDTERTAWLWGLVLVAPVVVIGFIVSVAFILALVIAAIWQQ